FPFGTPHAFVTAWPDGRVAKRIQGLLQCSLFLLRPVRPPPLSPVLSSRRLCLSRPPPRCRSRNQNNNKETAMNGRFLINRRDAKVMGVAAGLADYTGIDPLLIRLGFIAATLITGPVMILFYVLTGWLAPQQKGPPPPPFPPEK